MLPFQIELTPTDAKVILDGTDITRSVFGIYVSKASPMEVPRVVLEMASDAVAVAGEGVVEDDNKILQFLGEQDAQELIKTVAASTTFAVSPIETALEILKERARGSA